MSDHPPLPAPIGYITEHGLRQLRNSDASITVLYPYAYMACPHEMEVFTARQLRAYADAAIAAERERCAEIAEGFDACDSKHIAAAIRGNRNE